MEHASQPDEEKRPYHSQVRPRQAEETRRRILAAARSLFESRGYAATTLEAIAEIALVSPKTIAAVFGSKRTLLAEVINPVVTFISAYVYPLSYIGLGRLAMKRSPWLATIGIACGFVGSVVWSLFAGETYWINSLAHLGFDTQTPMLGKAYVANWGVFVMHGGWIILVGHLGT